MKLIEDVETLKRVLDDPNLGLFYKYYSYDEHYSRYYYEPFSKNWLDASFINPMMSRLEEGNLFYISKEDYENTPVKYLKKLKKQPV